MKTKAIITLSNVKVMIKKLNSLKILSLFCVALLASCSHLDDDVTVSTIELNQPGAVSAISRNTQYYTDGSGQISFQIKSTTYGAASHHNDREVTVDNGYVCVGGGALISPQQGHGALLVASYPTNDKKSWKASSKDHLVSSPLGLTVYAIGMKLNGISEAELMTYINIKHSQSSKTNHPTEDIRRTNGYKIIGGGAKAVYYGVGGMLTATFPNGDYWRVASKDHLEADQHVIHAYLIEIQENIPGFGQISTRVVHDASSPVSGHTDIDAELPTGYALTCPGGQSTYSGYGRMLFGVVPEGSNTAQAFSKDHSHSSTGSTTAFAIGIKKL